MGLATEIALAGSRARLASVKAQSALMDTQIKKNNAKLASIRAAIAANNAAYNATHSSSSSSSSGSTTSTGTTSSSQTYTGGNKTVSNYNGEPIIFNAPYTGVDFSGSTFQFHSSSGTLTIQNVTDKLIDFRNSAGNVLAKAYAAGSAGTIDGRRYSVYQFIVGVSGASNTIYAGNAGSYLWGNSGNVTDVLIGGAGDDTFFVGKRDGNDAIQNASSADNVNLYDVSLSDIMFTAEDNGTLGIAFNTGNVITIQSTDNLSAKINLADGNSYRFNHATKSWQSA